MRLLVDVHLPFGHESFVTDGTFVRANPLVKFHVKEQGRIMTESLRADCAFKRFFIRVDQQVTLQINLGTKDLLTDVALENGIVLA